MPAIFLVQKLSTACGSGALGSVVCLLFISGVSAPPQPIPSPRRERTHPKDLTDGGDDADTDGGGGDDHDLGAEAW